MLTTDCPCCDGTARLDDDLMVVACDGCGVIVELAPDPIHQAIDLAA